MPRVLWVLRILRIPLTLTYLSNRLLSVPFGDQQPPQHPQIVEDPSCRLELAGAVDQLAATRDGDGPISADIVRKPA